MFFKISYTENKSNKKTVHISCGTAEVYEDTEEKAVATFTKLYPQYEINSIEEVDEDP